MFQAFACMCDAFKCLLNDLSMYTSRSADSGFGFRRSGEWVGAKVVQPVQEAIPKVMNWVDQNQTAIAVGIGIAAGVAVIVLSGGAATPLVAATWIAGSAAVAGGVVALGTVGLNAYFQRRLTTNLWRNVGYAAGAAALTATVGFALSGGVVQQGLYTVGNTATRLCVAHPAAQVIERHGDEVLDVLGDGMIRVRPEAAEEIADELASVAGGRVWFSSRNGMIYNPVRPVKGWMLRLGCE